MTPTSGTHRRQDGTPAGTVGCDAPGRASPASSKRAARRCRASRLHWRHAREDIILNSAVQVPPPSNPFRRFCLWLLSLFGWRSSFTGFPGAKGVVVVYPHTSNWDFALGMLYRLGYGLRVHWLAKHSVFRWPVKRLLEGLGGIPVDRRAPQGAIKAIAEQFRRREYMWLAVTPEGTRSHTDHWKSGFYQIALAAGVPCALGYIDYSSKTLGIDTFLTFSGDAAADMEKIRAFYADKRGLRPAQASDIRLRPPASTDDPGEDRPPAGPPHGARGGKRVDGGSRGPGG